MNHQEIEQEEIVERYVQHQLRADVRLAFQEHYVACDECYQQVEATARFIAGVRNESRVGVLSVAPLRPRSGDVSSSWLSWLKPVFAIPVAASLLLAGTVLWLWLSKVPSLRQEVARAEQSRVESERNLAITRNQADEARRQLEIERAERLRLADQLQSRPQNNNEKPPGPDLIAAAHIPTATLEATRDSQGSGSQLTLPASANKAILLMQVRPGLKVRSFRVEILTRDGRIMETVTKTSLNRDGALKVSLPVQRLQSESYLVRLYAVQEGEARLLGEYVLTIHKE